MILHWKKSGKEKLNKKDSATLRVDAKVTIYPNCGSSDVVRNVPLRRVLFGDLSHCQSIANKNFKHPLITNIKRHEKKYELAGMSCGGCVNNVKQALLKVPGVTEAEVHLNPQSALLTLNKHIDVEELQTLLNKSGNYTIKEATLKA